jgi:hypothetical protein
LGVSFVIEAAMSPARYVGVITLILAEGWQLFMARALWTSSQAPGVDAVGDLIAVLAVSGAIVVPVGYIACIRGSRTSLIAATACDAALIVPVVIFVGASVATGATLGNSVALNAIVTLLLGGAPATFLAIGIIVMDRNRRGQTPNRSQDGAGPATFQDGKHGQVA